MPSRSTYVCVPCRHVGKDSGYCPQCREPMRHMGTRWRPPKKRNDRAWKQLEQNRTLWDEAAVAKVAAKSPYRFWLLVNGAVPVRMRVRNTMIHNHKKGVNYPPW